MSGQVFAIGAAAALLWWGGAKIGHGVKVAAHKTRCSVVKVVTLGHKHCAPKQK